MNNYTNVRFGRLVALESVSPGRDKCLNWRCICDCGNEIFVSSPRLTIGKTKSCGCLRTEKTIERSKTHGLSHHYLYGIWYAMMQRCHNPNNKVYPLYGGRGISVCEEWKDVNNFINSIPPRLNGMEIERIDNNGNYCPDNVIWADRKTQTRNTRRTIKVTINGVTKCAKDWAKEINVPYGTALYKYHLDNGFFLKELDKKNMGSKLSAA